jgi:hypothetical protein
MNFETGNLPSLFEFHVRKKKTLRNLALSDLFTRLWDIKSSLGTTIIIKETIGFPTRTSNLGGPAYFEKI